jgi:peptide/nickel transport system permease protein
MWKFILKRVGQMVVLFYIFLALLFLLLDLQPGDISQQFVGNPDIPPEARELMIQQLGLDQPKHIQLFNHLKNYSTFNMGQSWSQFPRDVSDILLTALPRTIFLFLTATILAYAVGFWTGKVVAWKRGTATEKGVMGTSIFLYTVFYPWFAILMLWFFAAYLKWFPVGKFVTLNFETRPDVVNRFSEFLFNVSGSESASGWTSALAPDANSVVNLLFITLTVATLAYLVLRIVVKRTTSNPRTASRYNTIGFVAIAVALVFYWVLNPNGAWAFDILWHSVIPVLTLTLVNFAGTTLLTRTSMIETVSEDYILTARAKGVPSRTIRDRHASRNALLPVTTSLVLALAAVIGGGILTEQIFSWPGIGQTYLAAIGSEDIPLAMGALALLGILSLVAHLVADILYAFLDPRIRVQG